MQKEYQTKKSEITGYPDSRKYGIIEALKIFSTKPYHENPRSAKRKEIIEALNIRPATLSTWENYRVGDKEEIIVNDLMVIARITGTAFSELLPKTT